MRLCRVVAILAVVALAGGSAFAAPAPLTRTHRHAKPDDLQRLQGIWRMTSQRAGGRDHPHNFEVRVRDDVWTFINVNGARKSDGSTYFLTLDRGVTPPALEWANNKNRTSGGWVASYRLEGDSLTVVYGPGQLKDGGVQRRPTNFADPAAYKMTFVYVGRER
jgi:uncharacterized protein (TIGR03067 family)